MTQDWELEHNWERCRVGCGNLGVAYELTGSVCCAALESAAEQSAVQDGALRSTRVIYEDIGFVATEHQEEHARKIIGQSATDPFTSEEPPLRVLIIRLSEQRHVLGVIADRRVVDWRSLSMFIMKMGTLCRARCEEETVDCVGGSISTGVLNSLLISNAIDPGLVSRIDAFCSRHEVNRLSVLVAVLCIVLHRCTKLSSFTVGLPIWLRETAEHADMIREVTIPIKADLNEGMAVSDVINAVNEAWNRILEQVEYDSVVDLQPGPLVPMIELESQEVVANLCGVWRVSYPSDFLVQIDGENDVKLAIWPGDVIAGTITDYFWDQYMQALKRAVEHPGERVGVVRLLQGEQQAIRFALGKQISHDNVAVHRLIEYHARSKPQQIAVVCGKDVITFEQLNRWANKIAHCLRWRGAHQGSVVGVICDRSVAAIVSILAVLKAGCTYLPLGSRHSASALQTIIVDAMPTIVLKRQNMAPQFNALQADMVYIDGAGNPVHRCCDDDLPLTFSLQDPAFLMYKQGDDGRLVGVQGTHRVLSNLVLIHQDWYGSRTPGNGSLWSDLDQGVALWEVFSCLCNGGCLYVVPDNVSENDREYILWLDEQRIETAYIPSGAMPELYRRAASGHSLRLSRVLTGEAVITKEEVAAIRARVPGVAITSVWGCVETGMVTLVKELDEERWQSTGVGGPAVNTSAYLLDSSGYPVPVGVRGQLFIGGAGTGSGYLRRRDLADRFVLDPFSFRPGSLMFRTGKVGRYLSDGSIELMDRGRSDFDSG